MDLAKSIGNNIRSLMENRSVTIVELAKALSISRQTLQNYLKGNNIIDSVKLVEIANYFSVPVTDLLKEATSPSNFLFRTALNYQFATDTISSKVMTCINSYYNLSKALGETVAYFPEQYNLNVNINGSLFDINYEWNDYFSSKLKMTEELRRNLMNLAIEQRNKLGLHDTNALAAISILQQKGINILFVDMGDSKTSGLSYVDEEKGCYIFVNCNQSLSLERIIFTVFHEYGHIILHRPLYKRKTHNIDINDTQRSFLDQMANAFAGYFLVPFEYLNNYNSTLNNLHSLNQLFPIKQQFQVSLQTLIISLGSYGYVNKLFVKNFFNHLRDNNAMEYEPEPILNLPEIHQTFLSIKNSKIITLLRNGYLQGMVTKETIMDMLWLDSYSAEQLIHEFSSFENSSSFFDILFN